MGPILEAKKRLANTRPPCIYPPAAKVNLTLNTHKALVAELVDALDSGSSGGNPVEVRFLSSAPSLKNGSSVLPVSRFAFRASPSVVYFDHAAG